MKLIKTDTDTARQEQYSKEFVDVRDLRTVSIYRLATG
jgi:hypothetical protein